MALLIFVLLDGGLVMTHAVNVQNATKEGARLGAVGAAPSAVASRVAQAGFGGFNGPAPAGNVCPPDSMEPALGAFNICVDYVAGPNGEVAGQIGSSIRVRVDYNYRLLSNFNFASFSFGGHWDVKSCALERLEQPAPSSGITTSTGTC